MGEGWAAFRTVLFNPKKGCLRKEQLLNSAMFRMSKLKVRLLDKNNLKITTNTLKITK